MLEKILSSVLVNLLTSFGGWVLSFIKREKAVKKEQDKNEVATDKVKNSKTKEEIDAALDAIGNRTSDK